MAEWFRHQTVLGPPVIARDRKSGPFQKPAQALMKYTMELQETINLDTETPGPKPTRAEGPCIQAVGINIVFHHYQSVQSVCVCVCVCVGGGGA